MKKFKIIVLFLLLMIPFGVKAESKVKLYFFHGDGCPHCAEEEEFFDEYLKENDNVEIVKYEVWHSSDNRELLQKVQDKINNHQNGVPYLVISDKAIVGYIKGNTDNTIKCYVANYLNDEEQVDKCIKDKYLTKNDKKKKYIDVVGQLAKGEDVDINNSEPETPAKVDPVEEDKTFNIPILGKISAKTVSLPLLSIVLGLTDGFNPCAMWVLVFLLTTLIGMNDKKKMIILGSVFLITSGLVYFLMMFTWLNVIINISMSIVFRVLIAIFALGAGIYNLYNYIKSLKTDDGCTVVNRNQRKKIMERIKEFVHKKSLIIAVLGIIILAIGVNLVELLCSAGLPMIYGEVLAINKITGPKALIYDLIYILFFMLDDFIVFFVAIKTMNLASISNKFSKYSHLIAGIIMLIIGILLIIKPSWLMFNF